MFNVYLKNCSSFWNFEIFVQLFSNCSYLKSLFEFQKLFMVLERVSCLSNFVQNFLFFVLDFLELFKKNSKVVPYFKLSWYLQTSRTYRLDWLSSRLPERDVMCSISCWRSVF